jgi:hypothetical protein
MVAFAADFLLPSGMYGGAQPVMTRTRQPFSWGRPVLLRYKTSTAGVKGEVPAIRNVLQ